VLRLQRRLEERLASEQINGDREFQKIESPAIRL